MNYPVTNATTGSSINFASPPKWPDNNANKIIFKARANEARARTWSNQPDSLQNTVHHYLEGKSIHISHLVAYGHITYPQLIQSYKQLISGIRDILLIHIDEISDLVEEYKTSRDLDKFKQIYIKLVENQIIPGYDHALYNNLKEQPNHIQPYIDNFLKKAWENSEEGAILLMDIFVILQKKAKDPSYPSNIKDLQKEALIKFGIFKYDNANINTLSNKELDLLTRPNSIKTLLKRGKVIDDFFDKHEFQNPNRTAELLNLYAVASGCNCDQSLLCSTVSGETAHFRTPYIRLLQNRLFNNPKIVSDNKLLEPLFTTMQFSKQKVNHMKKLILFIFEPSNSVPDMREKSNQLRAQALAIGEIDLYKTVFVDEAQKNRQDALIIAREQGILD